MSSNARPASAPQEPHAALSGLKLVPWPSSIESEHGTFLPAEELPLLPRTGQPDVLGVVDVFLEDLSGIGRNARVIADRAQQGAVKFSLVDEPELGAEGYRMRVSTDGIELFGSTTTGLFRGTRTLLQLLEEGPGQPIPCMRIDDSPLLGHRGVLIDVARKFHSLDFHLAMIREMAAYKLNVYQIHFSDDQSYTLPSERFPNLPTEGRSYSREDIRQLVECAERYHVTVVPEIDVPGHSRALNQGIPETNCTHAASPLGVVCLGSPASLEAVRELFSEVMEMIPGPCWHLGADEVAYDRYQGCSACAAALKSGGLSDVRPLYREFINRMNAFVKSHGRRMFVWEGFQPGGLPEIDKDIVVFLFDVKHEGRMPKDYLDAGYELMNTAWSPLYVADNIYMTTPEIIARWTPWMFGAGRSPQPFARWQKLEETPHILGAQVCSWAIEEKAEMGLLFGKGPGFPEYGRPGPRAQIAAERMWTGGRTSYKGLLERTGASYWE